MVLAFLDAMWCLLFIGYGVTPWENSGNHLASRLGWGCRFLGLRDDRRDDGLFS